jgi:cation diffusion facilitator CzcD-associated flavoprotein CzcO
MESFTGNTFHSATWDAACDLAGKDVAVIGTGASAVQFVPEIREPAAHVTVFQRTPPWVLPRRDRAITARERALFRRVPALQAAARTGTYWLRELNLLSFTRGGSLRAAAEKQARKNLQDAIADPVLRARLTPDYEIGCKRVLLSSTWYPARAQDDVSLVTTGVTEVRPHGVVDGDGVEHEVDVIVYGTGFRVMDIPLAHRLTGREGRTLAQEWQETGAEAHRGTTVAGFPNLFLLLGPNTGLGHTSVVFMIESQIRYIAQALDLIDDANRRMAWGASSVNTWYKNASGRITQNWPFSLLEFWQWTRRPDPADFVLRERRKEATR